MKEEYFTGENIIKVSKEIIEIAEQYSNRRSFEFIPDKACLLVTDMQNFFLKNDSHAFIPSAKAIIPGILQLIQESSKKNIPIIYTRHFNTDNNAQNMMLWWKRLITKNDPLSQISHQVFQEDSIVIEKTQYDAFYNTPLLRYLNDAGRTQLIICGVMTNLCCASTCKSAFIKGIQPFLPVDTTAAYNREFHQGTINALAFGFTQPILSDELIAMIRAYS